jgi:hypothetical protein
MMRGHRDRARGRRGRTRRDVAALDSIERRRFHRGGTSRWDGSSVDEEQAERMIKRFPRDLLQRGWEMITRDDIDIGAFLSRLDCPLLFAKHEGCLASTDEGFEDAAATFPEARLVSVTDAPLTSPEFAEALRAFCKDVVAAQGPPRRTA